MRPGERRSFQPYCLGVVVHRHDETGPDQRAHAVFTVVDLRDVRPLATLDRALKLIVELAVSNPWCSTVTPCCCASNSSASVSTSFCRSPELLESQNTRLPPWASVCLDQLGSVLSASAVEVATRVRREIVKLLRMCWCLQIDGPRFHSRGWVS